MKNNQSAQTQKQVISSSQGSPESNSHSEAESTLSLLSLSELDNVSGGILLGFFGKKNKSKKK